MSIKTWEQWQENEPLLSTPYAMQAEIDELRAALQERDAEIERLTGSELGLNRYLAIVQADLSSTRKQVDAQRKVLAQSLEALTLIRRQLKSWEEGDAAITAIQEQLK